MQSRRRSVFSVSNFSYKEIKKDSYFDVCLQAKVAYETKQEKCNEEEEMSAR
mgnify:FL=1